MRIPFLALLPVGLLASPLSAQTCGPLTFAFAAAGPGCPSSGLASELSADLLPSPSLHSCPVEFTLAPGPAAPPYGWAVPPFLILGATNPMIDLAAIGLPGCTLLARPDAIAAMAPSATWGGAFTLTVLVPASPVLIGVTGYAQGLAFAIPGVPIPLLSNGVAISIS